MSLTSRKELVLKYLIEDYILTAEAVGSRTLSKKEQLDVSPATIRNEMADLEDMGFIMQPHTSAGRIPTEVGYRYYVDHLMDVHPLPEKQMDAFNYYLLSRYNAHQEAMEEVVKLVADTTNYAAMLLLPDQGETEAVLNFLTFLPVSPTVVLMVVVTDNEQSYSEFIDISAHVELEELSKIEQALNQTLRGLSPQGWNKTLVRHLFAELPSHAFFIRIVLSILKTMLNNNTRKRYYVEGLVNLLEQPEFQDLERVKQIVTLLERPENIEAIIGESPLGLDIRIGKENVPEALRDCSLLIVRYESGRRSGYLGVIGPERMNYKACATLLTNLLEAFNRTFAQENMLVISEEMFPANERDDGEWQIRINKPHL